MIETNLLPSTEKNLLRAMKLRRVIVLGLVLVIVTITAVSAFFWAMDSFVGIYSESVSNELELLKNQSQASVSGQENEKISELNKTTASIDSSLKDQPLWTPLVEKLLADTPTEIKFETLDITSEDFTITIAGEASTRDTLVEFRKSLEQADFIESVDLPLENIITREKIPFTITITVKKDFLFPWQTK